MNQGTLADQFQIDDLVTPSFMHIYRLTKANITSEQEILERNTYLNLLKESLLHKIKDQSLCRILYNLDQSNGTEKFAKTTIETILQSLNLQPLDESIFLSSIIISNIDHIEKSLIDLFLSKLSTIKIENDIKLQLGIQVLHFALLEYLIPELPPSIKKSVWTGIKSLIQDGLKLGPILSCFQTKAFFNTQYLNKILELYPHPINSDEVASIIIHLFLIKEKVEYSKIEEIINVLAPICKSVDWIVVTKKLDDPKIVYKRENDALHLVDMFHKISGKYFPATALLIPWNNKSTQLSILRLTLDEDKLDMSNLELHNFDLPGDVISPTSGSWRCLQLYSTLFDIAANGFSIQVLDCLIVAASRYPEYILLGLARCPDPHTAVRAEVLRRLLPLFTGLPGSLASSDLVMNRLLSINPDLLVLLIRLSFKRANTIEEFLQIHQRLSATNIDIVKRVENEGTLDELLSYWCVLQEKAGFDLETKLLTLISQNPMLCKTLLIHLANISDNRPSAISQESWNSLLRTLQKVPLPLFGEELTPLLSKLFQPKSKPPLTADVIGNDNFTDSYLFQSNISDSRIINTNDANKARAPDDVEKEANMFFQRIFANEFSIDDAIMLLKRFKSSDVPKEQEIFRCMVHNLFDEYRYFHRYPDKELELTATLFGALIQNQLVSSITLGIGLRYVLEGLRKDPELSVSHEKLFRFGKIALEQFQKRLGEWPQYCAHIIQIPHLSKYMESTAHEIQKHVMGMMGGAGGGGGIPPSSFAPPPSSKPMSTMPPQQQLQQQQQQQQPPLPPQQPDQLYIQHFPETFNIKEFDEPLPSIESMQQVVSSTTTSGAGGSMIDPSALLSFQSPPLSGQGLNNATATSLIGNSSTVDSAETFNMSTLSTNIPGSTTTPTKESPSPTTPTISIIDKLSAANPDIFTGQLPPDATRDQISFIVNNIAKDNFATKIEDLKVALDKEYFNWFANYLVVKRISTMPNLHSIYLSILDVIDNSALYKAILDTTYHNATKLLQSSNITNSSSERSLLRNLGIWLGQITLAKNRPIHQRRMNLKALLVWGYENAKLIAVCSFVAKIIEGVKDSRIFRPPNPWLMAVLSLLRELYDLEDLKMNIKFEVQVLCKNINVRIEDIPRANILALCKLPVKDGKNPDFTVKAVTTASIHGSPATPMTGNTLAHQQTPIQSTVPPSSSATRTEEDDKQTIDNNILFEQTVIPNLASYVTINQSLIYFNSNPAQRRLVPLAIDRAIREIIQPVVEKSVSIASTTTKALVLKDFALEPNEIQLRNGAHLMISNLAGSLALVTCKEPLRLSISNHLRSLLSQMNVEQSMIEQISQVCSNDNLELGCILIEKASTERAIRDIDEHIAMAIQARRKARENGQNYTDPTLISSKFFHELPDMLKPKQGGLSQAQTVIYELFQRPRIAPSAASQPQPEAAPPQQPTLSPAMLPTGSMQIPQNLNSLNMSQSLDAYQIVFGRLDVALKSVQLQASGRDVTIMMLGTDHEILGHIRDMIIITQRTAPAFRSETAMAFCEIVFKRLMESVSSGDALRLEVFVGIIEALRDACGGAKKFVPDIVAWLSLYTAYVPSEESSRKFYRIILLLLLRAKLVKTQELDVYFATAMDSGRNIAWVEIALLFIRQCLSEGLAATYEFSNSFETVSKMRPTNVIIRKQLQKWLTDLKAIATPKEENKVVPPSPLNALREHVTALLERWLRIWNTSNDQLFSQYLQLMHQYGVLKTEDAADKFFRLSTELCVEACLKTGSVSNQPQADTALAQNLSYTVIDALSKLFLLLVRLADKESSDMAVRVNLFNRILSAIARTIIDDHEAKKNSKTAFDQRPYYRLLSNISQDLGVPDQKAEPNAMLIPLLTSYCQIYLALQPSVLPGFAYSWLQLISHRTFMPHLLLVKGQKCWPFMHRLILALLIFLQPFLKNAQLNDSIRRLYKGTLRVLLVLLHDFPEFLCDFHLSFCDIIPHTCVQLRNLILSAFPRTMKLPDPFLPNLKVDLLPEIHQAPRILTDYMAPLIERGIRQRLESYMTNRQPSDVPQSLISAVMVANPAASSSYNIPLLTAIVVYMGNQAVMQLQNKSPIQNSPTMEIFRTLMNGFDAEGRYYLFNTMANQLRYPNSHTHYFSCVILWLFSEAENEFLQEQITRVLLERLIVHRPHPWGLLITFIELIKNPRYSFWRKAFTRSAVEIEKVFDAVARSCMGPSASTTIQQQQLAGGGGSSGVQAVTQSTIR